MKRIAMWGLGTLTALVLLFGYHTSTSGATNATTVATGPTTAGGSTSGGASGGTSGSTTTGGTTVTGPAADTRWGPVQVRLTVADGKITNVDVVQYPTENRKDQQINARALPILTQETLAAQSADIDMVSGATVTSEGYVESLQGAIDQAGLS
ncbi:FMN-binding protein [Actinokineospora enzanensis]|uniref:FMN-binding protein n=1 Tax=Actinokineospora enzanensis TaxID=155975 RepID=UPI0003732445|nr:FMN-binding protein [Actinokineospora enzanensis]